MSTMSVTIDEHNVVYGLILCIISLAMKRSLSASESGDITRQRMNADDDVLSISALKRKVLNLEKAISKNQRQRVKFDNEPKRFMQSEIALNECIQELEILATVSSLFKNFVKLGALESLLTLLTHENIDIVSAVLNLFRELIDTDSEGDIAGIRILIDAIVNLDGLSMIMEALLRLDEKQDEDYETYGNTLSSFESIIECSPKMACRISETTSIIQILCQRIAVSKRIHDQNRFDCAEILSVILLNGGESSRKKFASNSQSFKLVISTLKNFVSRDPSKGDESEFVENIFDALSCVLLIPATREIFGDNNGVSFLINAIRSKRFIRHPALKLLNVALQKCAANCAKFVDNGGLKCLFAAFVRGHSKKHLKYKICTDEEEENVVCVIAHLFMYLPADRYERLQSKFKENSFEKIDRLVELHEKFSEKNSANDELVSTVHNAYNADRDLQQGIYALRIVDLLIGFLSSVNDENIKQYVHKLLNQYDISVDTLKESLNGLLSSMGDSDENNDSTENHNFQQKVIRDIIERF